MNQSKWLQIIVIGFIALMDAYIVIFHTLDSLITSLFVTLLCVQVVRVLMKWLKRKTSQSHD